MGLGGHANLQTEAALNDSTTEGVHGSSLDLLSTKETTMVFFGGNQILSKTSFNLNIKFPSTAFSVEMQYVSR